MEESLASLGLGQIISGLALGVAIGFLLQRGRMCMNTAFRDTIFIQEFSLFRAYTIALLIMIIGANVLNDMQVFTLARQPFFPLANIIGGFVFGLGMVLAGGCGSGIWYKLGEGQFNAIIGIIGFFIGIGATTDGILNPLYKLLRSVRVPIAGEGAPALWHFFGDTPTAKWAVIAVITIGLLIFILKGKPFSVKKQKGYTWPVTGVLFGILGVIAFWASATWEGFPRGMSFTTPTRELFFEILTGSAKSQFAPMYALGPFQFTWASLYIIGVPVGAYISARLLKEFKWKVPPVGELLTVFGGSLMMGFGAALGGGCNVGQALTGASTLSIGSIVAAICIILGNWTMVYFKFIKPMAD